MRTIFFGLLMTLGLVIAPAADATLVRAFPMRALTVNAHDIVRGHVLDSESIYDPVFRRVYTHTRVQVIESLAGSATVGEVVEVRQIGGLLDGIETRVVGTAELALGAEVVLFTRTDSAYHYLIGMAQGAYAVDRRGPGDATVRRGVGGLRIAPIHGPTAPEAANRLTLEALRAQVLETLRGQEGP